MKIEIVKVKEECWKAWWVEHFCKELIGFSAFGNLPESALKNLKLRTMEKMNNDNDSASRN